MAKKILLADDSITIQKVVRITLADGDYELINVDNGEDAISRAREFKPDLVLADVVMPGKDGYQVCEAIKSDPALRHIPVVLLAGSFEGFDEIKGAQIGADGYIIKPFESTTLISKVEEMLARKPVAAAPAPEPKPAAAPAPAPAAPAPKPAAVPAPAPVPAPVEEDLFAAPEVHEPAAEPSLSESDLFAEPAAEPEPAPAPAPAAEAAGEEEMPDLFGDNLPPEPAPAPEAAGGASDEELWGQLSLKKDAVPNPWETQRLAEAASASAPEAAPAASDDPWGAPAEPTAPAAEGGDVWGETPAAAPEPAVEPDLEAALEPEPAPAASDDVWGAEPAAPAAVAPETDLWGDASAAAPEALEPMPGLETTSLTDGQEATAAEADRVPTEPLHSFVGQEAPDPGLEPSGLELDTPAPVEEPALSEADLFAEPAVEPAPAATDDLWSEQPTESAEPAPAEPELSMDDLDAADQPEEAAAAPLEEAPADCASEPAEAAPEAICDDELLAEPELAEPAALEPEPVAPISAVAAPAVPAAITAAADALSAAVQAGMSKAELSGLIKDVVEKVVWEVVPALAEAMIEERLLQMEQARAS